MALCCLVWLPLALPAEPIKSWQVGSSPILKAAYSPNGENIATASQEGKIQILSRESGGVVAAFDLKRGVGSGLAWTPDSRAIAAGGTDSDPPRKNGVRLKVLGKVRLWNLSTKETLFTHDVPDGAIFDVDISASGNTIGAAGYHPKANPKGWVNMWKIANGQQFNARYGRPGDAIFKIQYAPDGKSFFVATADKVYQYGFETSEPVIFNPSVRYIQDIDISTDGRYLAIASGDSRSYGATQIWDIQAQQELVKVNLPAAFKSVFSVAFSQQGDRIVMGTGESRAQVIIAGVSDGEFQAVFSGHSKSVSSVAFSPDGKEIVAGDEAGHVKIWKAEPADNLFWFSQSAEWNGQQLWSGNSWDTSNQLTDTAKNHGQPIDLADLAEREELEISLTRIRPDQLSYLGQLTGLQKLILITNQLKDPQFDFLAQLPHLHTLEINGLDTQGNGLRQIAQLPNLKTLSLLDDTLQDDDLAILGRSQSLTKLTLRSHRLTAAGLKHLEGLENLSELDLTATNLGRSGQLNLAKLPNLRALRLGTLNEQTLTALAENKKLQQLEFDASVLTIEQMLHLVDFEMWPRATIRNNPVSHDALMLFAVKNPMSREERLKYYRDMTASVKQKLASTQFEQVKVDPKTLGGADQIVLEQIEFRINFLEQERLRYLDVGGGFGPAAAARRSGNFAARLAIERDIDELLARRDTIYLGARRLAYGKLVGLTKEESKFAEAFNLMP